MLKNSLPSLTIIGGIALIFLTFSGNQQVKWWANTTTVSQVVQEFNSTKQIKARSWDVPIQTIPEISEEEVLSSLGRSYETFDVNSNQRQTLAAVLRTKRLPECTIIRVSEIDISDPQTGVQLEILISRSNPSSQFASDGNLAIPLELSLSNHVNGI